MSSPVRRAAAQTAIASGAFSNPVTLDLNGIHGRSERFAAALHSTVAATLVIEASLDKGATWVEVASVAAATAATSGLSASYDGPLVSVHMRARAKMGALGDVTVFVAALN